MIKVSAARSALRGLLFGTLAALAAGPAAAMTWGLTKLDLSNGPVGLITAHGEIVPGDADELSRKVNAVAREGYAVGLSLNSAGGNVVEASLMAKIIRDNRVIVVVTDKNYVCASACFILLAASPLKIVERGAGIGVHSASGPRGEGATSLAITTLMAREAKAYGVPNAIIGRIVTTEPNHMAWLSTAELRSMGVKIVGEGSTASAPSAPAAPVPSTQPSDAFSVGVAQRREWETWFNSIPYGSFQIGALYWTGKRSKATARTLCAIGPEASEDPTTYFYLVDSDGTSYRLFDKRSNKFVTVNRADFTAGCMEAKRRLDPTDRLRMSSPDYRRGWNSVR